MRKMIIFFLAAMLCLTTFTSALAADADAQGYYRADYTIPANKTKYAPSSIYGTRNKFSFPQHALYELEECTYSGDSSINTLRVYMYNRNKAEMITGSYLAVCGQPLTLKYRDYKDNDTTPEDFEQCKPVTMKSNTDHYYDTVMIKARFIP